MVSTTLVTILLAAAALAGPLPATRPMEPARLDELLGLAAHRFHWPGENPQHLRQVHALLERYFAEPGSRRQILAELEQTGANANLAAALVRVRSTWTDLSPGTYTIDEPLGPRRVRYVLVVPAGYDARAPTPMLVEIPPIERMPRFLGRDVPAAMRVATEAGEIAAARFPRHLVLVPLVDADLLGGASYVGLAAVTDALHHAFDRVNLDPDRVLVRGSGLGGSVAWDLVLHHPTYFAGLIVLGGGANAESQRLRLPTLLNHVVALWHDADDPRFSVQQTRTIVNALRRLGNRDVFYEETRGLAEPGDAVLRKLGEGLRQVMPNPLEQVRIQSNRSERAFNRSHSLQLHQPLNPGDEQPLIVARGKDWVPLFTNAMRGEARRVGLNHYEVRLNNVESARLYFSSDMVEFRVPVKITLFGRRGGFEGRLTPSLDVMLRDQLTLGRGWGTYTAYVDLPVTP